MSTETRTTDDGRPLTERAVLSATRNDGGVVLLVVYATEDISTVRSLVTAAKVGRGDGLMAAAYQADPIEFAEMLAEQGLLLADEDDDDHGDDA